MSLLQQLDRTLAADFENHARIGPRHVGITVFFRRKIPVGFGVGLGHIEGRHADAVSKFVDGDREVVLLSVPSSALASA